ncbi:helix-turn-helix transcriptional regulator [Streptococcus agalactiae]|uniref:helix-turn-helix transcriptional regulator n=1 Tax=Streptococcus agalactiae TaxID=1311 RepID=UPI00178C5AB9|nr:helix-turn-helix transcriptional regulator [Streptococcus agalactiae]
MKNSLQKLRKSRKLSQAELAVALGVTRQTIISLEKEKYTASLELAFKIARYFDKQIEEVFIIQKVKEDRILMEKYSPQKTKG